MTILLAAASAAEWADAARRAAVLRAGADIIAVAAAKWPPAAAIADLANAAAQADGSPAAALWLAPESPAGRETPGRGAAARLRQVKAAGIKYLCLSAADYQAAQTALAAEFMPKTPFAGLQALLVIPFSAPMAGDFGRWPDFARQWGLAGVIFQLSDNSAETAQQRGRILAALRPHLRALQRAGLQAGVSGARQMADIPRLLALAPDILGFCPAAGNITAANIRRAAAAAAKSAPARESRPAAETDKILVSDYIVPMRIGAYNHEKGAAQRVCFNVAAEISRIAGRPHNMNDIFSYDIILDAIAGLAGSGHWEFVESAAEELAAILLRFPRVAQVMVRVEKLDLAPRAVGVEICRRKS